MKTWQKAFRKLLANSFRNLSLAHPGHYRNLTAAELATETRRLWAIVGTVLKKCPTELRWSQSTRPEVA